MQRMHFKTFLKSIETLLFASVQVLLLFLKKKIAAQAVDVTNETLAPSTQQQICFEGNPVVFGQSFSFNMMRKRGQYFTICLLLLSVKTTYLFLPKYRILQYNVHWLQLY